MICIMNYSRSQGPTPVPTAIDNTLFTNRREQRRKEDVRLAMATNSSERVQLMDGVHLAHKRAVEPRFEERSRACSLWRQARSHTLSQDKLRDRSIGCRKALLPGTSCSLQLTVPFCDQRLETERDRGFWPTKSTIVGATTNERPSAAAARQQLWTRPAFAASKGLMSLYR